MTSLMDLTELVNMLVQIDRCEYLINQMHSITLNHRCASRRQNNIRVVSL